MEKNATPERMSINRANQRRKRNKAEKKSAQGLAALFGSKTSLFLPINIQRDPTKAIKAAEFCFEVESHRCPWTSK